MKWLIFLKWAQLPHESRVILIFIPDWELKTLEDKFNTHSSSSAQSCIPIHWYGGTRFFNDF